MPDSASTFRYEAVAAVEDVLRHEPEFATALGDHRYDDRLDDRSEAGRAQARAVYARHRDTINAIDPGTLGADDRADQQILVGALDLRIFAIDDLHETLWDPLLYNPGDGLYPLIARETIPLPDRLRAIASRLDQIPSVVELARTQLVQPSRIHVETALQQNPGTISLVTDEVNRLAAQEPSMRALIETAQEKAVEALERHGAFLEELLGRERGDEHNFRLGPEKYNRKLELTLNTAIPAGEVLKRARGHLDQVSEEIEEACRSYLQANGLYLPAERSEAVRAALSAVANERPDNHSVVDVATRALEDAVAAVENNGLCSVPDDEVVVQVMPEFRRGIAVAYCDSPGPLESGGDTFIAVAPTPQTWTEERVESFYREYNSAMIVNLMVHEAMPGHALQIAHGRTFAGSTPVRQVFMSGSFIEGWAVQAERLMAESGHGGPAVRLQQLKMQLRMTINAILDAEVHAGVMTEHHALELMTARGYQEEGEASGKWRRACLTSAQLSTYFVGYTELAEVFDRLGTFTSYDGLLACGSPPPRLIESLI